METEDCQLAGALPTRLFDGRFGATWFIKMVPCPLDWTGVSLEVCRLAGLFLWFIATGLGCVPGGSYVIHSTG